MKKGLLLLILVIFCSSCSTILTGKYSRVQFQTNKNLKLVVRGDTIERPNNTPVDLIVTNSKHPLSVIAIDSSRQEFLPVASHKPFAYWLNLIPTIYFTGFLVDEISGKKWRYPRRVYIESTEDDIRFYPYIPMDSTLLERRNKLTFTPLSLINGYHPSWEFGYERLHKNSTSTQLSIGILKSWNNDYARNSRGILATIEQKKFWRSQEKSRVYGSIAVEYLHKEHDALLDFIVVDAQGNIASPFRAFSRITPIRKQFISVIPRIGIQHYFTSRLVGEAYFGIGIRARKVTHLNRSPFARHEDDFDLFFDAEFLSNRQTKNMTPNFDLNFRLAWAF